MAITTTRSPTAAPQFQTRTAEKDAGAHVDVSEMDTPAHPVPSMQGAFEESILESTEESEVHPAPVEVDAHARRHRLLESKTFDDSWITRWSQRPTAQYHPLLKLMAQIVFGMHLLQQQQAKSDKEVVKILQTHVNEVDTFLERTAEDFTVAIRDAEDRIRCLRLPLTHIDVFETMLGDQRFRSQLLVGNEKIEKIIERTTRAMNAYLLDVEVGVQANRDLHRFMKRVHDRWPKDQRAIADVYSAMRGNEQSWKRYLRDLQHKGTVLGGLLASLQKLIDEMSKMAAHAHTKTKIQTSTDTATAIEPVPAPSTPATNSTASPEPSFAKATTASPRSPQRRTSDLNKPLPVQPALAPTTVLESAPKPHPVAFAERYERPRQSPPEPSSPQRTYAAPAILHPRPKTADEYKQARAADARHKPSELLNFLQRPDPLRSNPNPLRSNPPDESELSPPSRTSADTSKLSHSTSGGDGSDGGGTSLIVGTVGFNHDGAKVTRAVDVVSVATASNIDLSQTPTQQESRTLQSADGRTNSPAGGTEHAERRAAMKNTGFARRLSKRLKHLPPDVNPPQSPTSATGPPGSPGPLGPPGAPGGPNYTSPFRPSHHHHQQQHQPTTFSSRQPPSPPDSAYASIHRGSSPKNAATAGSAAKPRPISGLGPLMPFENQVLSTLRSAKSDAGLDASAERGGTASSRGEVRSVSSNKSRASGFKSLFRSKWNATGKAVVA